MGQPEDVQVALHPRMRYKLYFKSIAILSLLCLCFTQATFAGALDDGLAAYNAKNYQLAFQLWQPLAKQGNADAEYNLGLLYINGLGVLKNDRMALMWFIRAAQQGLANAQYNAGVLYYLGKGIYPNYQSAIAWWQQAANKGHAGAENNLAVMYAFGYGTDVDQKKALTLWTAAAQQGQTNAIDSLIQAYAGRLAGFKSDPVKEKYWRAKKTAR